MHINWSVIAICFAGYVVLRLIRGVIRRKREEYLRKMRQREDELRQAFIFSTIHDQLLAAALRARMHQSAQFQASSFVQSTIYDPYDILGVDRGDSDEDIKRAYRQKLKEYHPDTAREGMANPTMITKVTSAFRAIENDRRIINASRH